MIPNLNSRVMSMSSSILPIHKTVNKVKRKYKEAAHFAVNDFASLHVVELKCVNVNLS